MVWIESLNLQEWLVNVFAGNPDIFFAIALLFIITMSSYFRMTSLTLFIMAGVFVLMFSNFMAGHFIVLFGIIGGLAIGFALRKVFQ